MLLHFKLFLFRAKIPTVFNNFYFFIFCSSSALMTLLLKLTPAPPLVSLHGPTVVSVAYRWHWRYTNGIHDYRWYPWLLMVPATTDGVHDNRWYSWLHMVPVTYKWYQWPTDGIHYLHYIYPWYTRHIWFYHAEFDYLK